MGAFNSIIALNIPRQRMPFDFAIRRFDSAHRSWLRSRLGATEDSPINPALFLPLQSFPKLLYNLLINFRAQALCFKDIS
jgi:hypothetical protein